MLRTDIERINRSLALRCAIDSSRSGEGREDIVKRAETYYAFLSKTEGIQP
jgi:hypothetical protein